jgi:hypothetical protein
MQMGELPAIAWEPPRGCTSLASFQLAIDTKNIINKIAKNKKSNTKTVLLS